MAINEKKFGDHPYVAFLHGKRVELYAPSLYAARQKAVEHFRPKKKDLYLIALEPATEDAETDKS